MLCRAVPIVLAGFLAAPAVAEITPEELWSGLQGVADRFGADLSGAVAGGGDGLEITGTTLTWDSGLALTFPPVRFKLAEDGVDMILPPSFEVGLEMGAARHPLAVTLTETRIVASGSGEDLVVQVTGTGVLARLEAPGNPESFAELEWSAVNTFANIFLDEGATSLDVIAGHGSLRLGLSDRLLALDLLLTQLSHTTNVSLPFPTRPMSDLTPWLDDGGVITSGGFAAEMSGMLRSDVAFPGVEVSFEGAEPAYSTFLDSGGLFLDGTSGLVHLAGSLGPLGEVAAFEGGFWLPLTVQSEPQPVGLRLVVGGLTFGPVVWEFLDASGTAIRDPMGLNLTMAADDFEPGGGMVWLSDPFGGGMARYKVQDFLTEGTLRALGGTVEVVSSVDIVNDGSDMVRPIGGFDLTVEGWDQIASGLTAMGILSAGEVQFVQSMFEPRGDGWQGFTFLDDGETRMLNGQVVP